VREIACWARCRHMKNCKSELVRVLVRLGVALACAIFILKRRPFIPPIRVLRVRIDGHRIHSANEVADVLDIEYSVDMSNAPKNAAGCYRSRHDDAHEITGLAFRRIHESAPPNFTTYDESVPLRQSSSLGGRRSAIRTEDVNALTVPIVDALALTTPAASFSSTMT